MTLQARIAQMLYTGQYQQAAETIARRCRIQADLAALIQYALETLEEAIVGPEHH